VSQTLVRSPITGGSDVVLVRSIPCSTVVLEYLSVFGIDVSRLMKGHRELLLYKCRESGYRFYHPSDITGDSMFYHQLEKYEWYYMPRKWEFEESLRFIMPGSAVLDVGAGRGEYVRTVLQRVPRATCVGLDLNEHAARLASERGVQIVGESLADHSDRCPSRYDAVTLFQVLEHVADPMPFLQRCVRVLKPGGLLIIAVPDNSERASESIFVRVDNILNMPPHHQGLWDIPSLSFLAKVLPLRLEYLAVEPATADHHRNSYRGLIKADLIRRFGKVCGLAVYMVGRPFYNHALRHLSGFLPAHSILGIFRKLP
jgi:ubiquinone/menaquinone biosynthesis C-methylase UbiE